MAGHSPMYFDTHVHFDLIKDAAEAVIPRAVEAGVERMIAVGVSAASSAAAVAIAARFPDRIRAAVGYDRDCAASLDAAAALGPLPEDPLIVAIGEIGLDFHYSPDTAASQTDLFARMLETARARRLPVLVHSREAEDATLRLLREHASRWPGPADRIGALHCFTGGEELARSLVSLGFYISFSGIVTFRNADALRQAALGVPDDRLLIETDAPLLAPVPHRGQPNEPAYLPRVAETLARVRGCPIEHIAEITTANARRLFGWG